MNTIIKRRQIFSSLFILMVVGSILLMGCKNSPGVAQSRTITPTPTSVSSDIPTKDPTEAQAIQDLKNKSDITLEDNGKTFTFNITQRFFVFLDDEQYPVDALTCGPESVIGMVSNGFFRGPHRYPAYFEASKSGKCTLQDGDFSVEIIVSK